MSIIVGVAIISGKSGINKRRYKIMYYKKKKLENSLHNKDSNIFIKKVPSNFIDLIVIDPPYDLPSLEAGTGSLSKRMQRVYDELKEDSLEVSIDKSIFPELIRVMKKDKINIYIFCNKSQIPMYLDYFVGKVECSFDIIKWVKTNSVPAYNNKYNNDTEYCLYFRKGGYCNPKNNADASTLYHSPINSKDKKIYNHSTIKPEGLITKLIKNSSREGDLVADFFMGSGTTCSVAKKLKRKYLGCELLEKHYITAKARINKQLVKLW